MEGRCVFLFPTTGRRFRPWRKAPLPYIYIYTHTHYKSAATHVLHCRLLRGKPPARSIKIQLLRDACNVTSVAEHGQPEYRVGRIEAARSSQLPPSPATCTETSTNDLVDHTHELAKGSELAHSLRLLAHGKVCCKDWTPYKTKTRVTMRLEVSMTCSKHRPQF